MNVKNEKQVTIVAEFQDGTDIPQLCEDHSLPLVKVCRVLVSNGEALPEDLEVPDGTRKQRHAERNAHIITLRKAGFSYAMLAEEFGLSDGRIGDICREAKKDAEEQPATS